MPDTGRLGLFYFLLWSFISTFLLGFWVWSSYILFKQKIAWRAYAEKRKLKYEGGGFYVSPRITGVIDGYAISAFTGDHTQFDPKLQRRLTGIEVTLKTCLEGRTALATGGMVQIISLLTLPNQYKPEIKGWDDSYSIQSLEQAVAAAYFTPERLNAILSLTKIKNLWVVVVFLDGQGFLRIDIADPISDQKRLDILLKKMLEIASILELKKGEDISIMRKAREIRDGQSVIKIDDETVFTDPNALSLELEDDEFVDEDKQSSALETKKNPAKKSD